MLKQGCIKASVSVSNSKDCFAEVDVNLLHVQLARNLTVRNQTSRHEETVCNDLYYLVILLLQFS